MISHCLTSTSSVPSTKRQSQTPVRARVCTVHGAAHVQRLDVLLEPLAVGDAERAVAQHPLVLPNVLLHQPLRRVVPQRALCVEAALHYACQKGRGGEVNSEESGAPYHGGVPWPFQTSQQV